MTNLLPPQTAPYFNGKNAYLYTNLYISSYQFTVEAWIYATKADKLNTIIGWGNLLINLSFGVLSANLEGDSLASQTININQWTHIAVSFTSNTYELNIFIDGKSFVSNQFMNINTNAGTVVLGANLNSTNNTASSFFNGYISDVRLWSISRTQAEIVAGMNQRLTIPTPNGITGLSSYWLLDSIDGGMVEDVSGNNNNALVSGSISILNPKNTLITNEETDVPNGQSTLSDIARGMQHVVNTTQEVMEQHFLRTLDRFLDSKGNAITQRIQLDANTYVDAPLLALINPSSLALDEMEVEMTVRVDSETVKKFPMEPESKNEELNRTSFTVTLAPLQPINVASNNNLDVLTQRAPNIIDIRMKFKSGDRPEGVSRIIDEFTSRIIPMQVASTNSTTNTTTNTTQ